MAKCCFCNKRVWFWRPKSFYSKVSHVECHWHYIVELLRKHQDSTTFLNVVLGFQDRYREIYGIKLDWPDEKS